MQPETLIRREYKVKIYIKKEKIHVGSESWSGSKTNRNVGSKKIIPDP
jgi:hypothetical protein